MARNVRVVTPQDWQSIEFQCQNNTLNDESWWRAQPLELRGGVFAYVSCSISEQDGTELQLKDNCQDLIDGSGAPEILIGFRIESQFAHVVGVEGICEQTVLKVECEVEGRGQAFSGSCGTNDFSSAGDASKFGGFGISIIASECTPNNPEVISGHLTAARGTDGDQKPKDASFKISLQSGSG